MSQTILEAKHISKTFYDPVALKVLHDISFFVIKSEFVAVIGKSGCGKSSLLYILSTMDTDYEGDLIIDNESMRGKKDSQLARLRNEKIGFVFQFHYLLNEFTALRNVMLPALKLNKYNEQDIKKRAMEKLDILNISNLASKKAYKLSGGEKQRVAIARALINDPLIIMGDEPTGNLDKKNSDNIFGIFQQLTRQFNQTILVVTHDNDFAERTDRIIEIEDGKIIHQ
jgi:lipoprotein-releasing system ATP-binding protein